MCTTGGAWPDVSIIIPSLNSDMIDKTLGSLLAQTSFNRILEILVIGLDQPGLILKREPIHFISTQVPVTAPVARNLGIREARGAYLAFIDADCIADSRWLETLLSAQREGHSVVGGSVSLEVENYWQLCYNLTMFHEFLPAAPAGERYNFGTLNLCVTMKVVERVGLFDERLAREQDTEWTLCMRRHGYRLHFVPEAVVRHLSRANSLSEIIKLWYRSGLISAQIRQDYRDIIATPPFLGRRRMMVMLSPLVGAFVTARIFARAPRLTRYIHTLPVVFLTKVAWCLGASRHVL